MSRYIPIVSTFIAAVIAAGILAVLVSASYYFGAKDVVSVSIFGSVIVLLHLVHFFFSFWKEFGHYYASVFNNFFIFFLIAASYTPIYLIVLPSALGWSLFGVTWGLVLFGMTLRLWGGGVTERLASVTFFVLDWLIVVAFVPLHKILPLGGLRLLTLGGLFYTLGFLLEQRYLKEGRKSSIAVMTPLLILGNISHFLFLLDYVF